MVARVILVINHFVMYLNAESLWCSSEINNIVCQLYFNFLKKEQKEKKTQAWWQVPSGHLPSIIIALSGLLGFLGDLFKKFKLQMTENQPRKGGLLNCE